MAGAGRGRCCLSVIKLRITDVIMAEAICTGLAIRLRLWSKQFGGSIVTLRQGFTGPRAANSGLRPDAARNRLTARQSER